MTRRSDMESPTKAAYMRGAIYGLAAVCIWGAFIVVSRLWRTDEPDAVGCCRHTFHCGGCPPVAVLGKKGSGAWPPWLDRSGRHHCRLWGADGAACERGLVVRARRSRRCVVSRRHAIDGRGPGRNGPEGTITLGRGSASSLSCSARWVSFGEEVAPLEQRKISATPCFSSRASHGWLHRRNAARQP